MNVVPAKDLVQAFADFTGLHFDGSALNDRVAASKCRSSKSGRRPNHMSFSKGMVCARAMRDAVREAEHCSRHLLTHPCAPHGRATVGCRQSAEEAEMLKKIMQPYEQMLDMWIEHYGIKVALKDHPAVIARRARLR